MRFFCGRLCEESVAPSMPRWWDEGGGGGACQPTFFTPEPAQQFGPLFGIYFYIGPTKTLATAGVRGYSQTRTKNRANPSLFIRSKPLTFYAAAPAYPQNALNKKNKPLTFIPTAWPRPNKKQTPHFFHPPHPALN